MTRILAKDLIQRAPNCWCRLHLLPPAHSRWFVVLELSWRAFLMPSRKQLARVQSESFAAPFHNTHDGLTIDSCPSQLWISCWLYSIDWRTGRQWLEVSMQSRSDCQDWKNQDCGKNATEIQTSCFEATDWTFPRKLIANNLIFLELVSDELSTHCVIEASVHFYFTPNTERHWFRLTSWKITQRSSLYVLQSFIRRVVPSIFNNENADAASLLLTHNLRRSICSVLQAISALCWFMNFWIYSFSMRQWWCI